MIVVPSIFSVRRKAAALARVLPTFAVRVAENAARLKWMCAAFGGVRDIFFFHLSLQESDRYSCASGARGWPASRK